MLVLSRSREEELVINGDVTVKIISVRGDKVRLGIKAPPEVTVHRKEVHDAIKNKADEAPSTGVLVTEQSLARLRRNYYAGLYLQHKLCELAADNCKAVGIDPGEESRAADAARSIVLAGIDPEDAASQVILLSAEVGR